MKKISKLSDLQAEFKVEVSLFDSYRVLQYEFHNFISNDMLAKYFFLHDVVRIRKV